MPDQVHYYNHFGELYEESILACPEPELWTTDYKEQGRVYKEMKERIRRQRQLITDYFKQDEPVLDIGCGFGRQAVLLAKEGFVVAGTDTSNVFIAIAKKLFAKYDYKGSFTCMDIINEDVNDSYKQLLLLDVLEHIKPSQRRAMLKKIYKMAVPGAILVISLPHVKKRWSSQINNKIRRRITQYFSYFLKREEHPYPIPGKRNILKLVKGVFELDRFEETPATDYYVFRRL